MLDSRRLDVRAEWVALKPPFGTRSSTFPALAWEECAASGTSKELLLDSTLSGCSSHAPPLVFLPVVWVPRSPHLLVALPQVPNMHMVTVTLACMSMALSLKSRACKEGAEEPDGAKPGNHNKAGLSAHWGYALLFEHVQLYLQPHCCRKWCEGLK